MRLRDDTGVELNAEYAVEAGAGYLSLILESSGGRVPGSANPRNHEYVPALRLLLQRLKDRRAVLKSALVASVHLVHLGDPARTLPVGTVTLADVDDLEELRLLVTGSQGEIGRPPDTKKPGNNRKRLELRLDVPGYDPSADAARLETDLAQASRQRVDHAWPTADPEVWDVDRHLADGEREATSWRAADSAGGRGAGFGEPEMNALVERAAMDAVERDYTSRGWRVMDVSRQNLGWDLECSHSSRARSHHIEVKGVAGSRPSVLLTANERAAVDRETDWYIAVVTNALTDPVVEYFSAGEVVEAAQPSQFRVDLTGRSPIADFPETF